MQWFALYFRKNKTCWKKINFLASDYLDLVRHRFGIISATKYANIWSHLKIVISSFWIDFAFWGPLFTGTATSAVINRVFTMQRSSAHLVNHINSICLRHYNKGFKNQLEIHLPLWVASTWASIRTVATYGLSMSRLRNEWMNWLRPFSISFAEDALCS